MERFTTTKCTGIMIWATVVTLHSLMTIGPNGETHGQRQKPLVWLNLTVFSRGWKASERPPPWILACTGNGMDQGQKAEELRNFSGSLEAECAPIHCTVFLQLLIFSPPLVPSNAIRCPRCICFSEMQTPELNRSRKNSSGCWPMSSFLELIRQKKTAGGNSFLNPQLWKF